MWIHQTAAPMESDSLLVDARRRLQQPGSRLPLAAYLDAELIAAAYFKLLGGNVATLGGVRAAPRFERLASDLVRQLANQLATQGLVQIQAVIPIADAHAMSLVQAAGFERLATVQHVWLDLSPAKSATVRAAGDSAAPAPLGKLRWIPATSVARKRMEDLIEATFEDTLDCPALNTVRGKAESLDGFLDGLRFRDVMRWQLLTLDGEIVGCVLMSEHAERLAELVYMGLIPAARGQKLGNELLRHALRLSSDMQARTLVAAVDTNNAPALRIYLEFGFQVHQQFSVWLCG